MAVVHTRHLHSSVSIEKILRNTTAAAADGRHYIKHRASQPSVRDACALQGEAGQAMPRAHTCALWGRGEEGEMDGDGEMLLA